MNVIAAPSRLPELFNDKQIEDKTLTIEQKKEKIKNKKPLPLYNVVFIGHVDSGKSTTIGRLLFDTNRVSSHLLEQYKKQASAENKESFAFAWILDKTRAERKRGITIDLAHAEWDTPKGRYFTIIDAPGHADFIKNMITGTSQADLAVLLVDAKKGLLESDITEEHAFLVRASGVNSIIVALNKINMISNVQQRMQIINERIEEVSLVLRRCGFDQKNIIFVPVNSFDGWNISNYNYAHQIPGWTGPNLVDALDQIPLPEYDLNQPLRLSIENTFGNIGGTNIVVSGKVMSGILVPGQQVLIKPSNVVGIASSIEMHHKRLSYATAGANIGIDLKKVDASNCNKASIISDNDSKAPKSCSSFVLKNALIKYHPSKLTVGSHLIVHYQTGNVCCEILKIKDVRNLATKEFKQGQCNFVQPGCLAVLHLKPDRPIVVEPDSVHQRNSRVMLRDSNKTIGFGVVSEVEISKHQA